MLWLARSRARRSPTRTCGPCRRRAVGAHHPAGLRTGIADLDLASESRQVMSSRQPTRPRADHQHPFAAAPRRRIEPPSPLERHVSEEALDRVNRHRAVEVCAIAVALARVVADPPVDRRERVVCHRHTPRTLMLAGLHMRQPGLDVLFHRAGRIARRQQIDIHRALLADRPRARAAVREIGQRRDVQRGTGRARGSPSLGALQSSPVLARSRRSTRQPLASSRAADANDACSAIAANCASSSTAFSVRYRFPMGRPATSTGTPRNDAIGGCPTGKP